MRILPTLFALAVLTAGPSASAQESAMAGSFAASFEKVVDNCKDIGLELTESKIAVTQNGKRLTVKISDVPPLLGKVGRRGKLRAEGEGPAASTGVTAKYGLNGTISEKDLQAAFVVEFFKNGKPLCTQSWSVSGKRTKF